jgi:hypothetical protein
MKYLRELVTYGESNKIDYVSVGVIKGILDAPNEQTLEKWKNMFADTKVRNSFYKKINTHL